MLVQHKKIAIVGGGPGGLTLARLLQQKGIEVKVYERDLSKDSRVQGSPLDLHEESGLAALRSANLFDEFKNNFLAGADRMKIVGEQADVMFSDHDDKPEENFGFEHFRPEIDRGALRKILLESLLPQTVVWNAHFISMEKQGEGWLLHFKDGSKAYADVVIAADGANSKIRPYLTDIKPFFTGIVMLEGNIYDAKNTVPNISTLLQGGKIMAFGNKKNILMGQKAGGEIGFYISFRAHENWAAQSGLDFSDKEQVLHWFTKKYSEWSPIWQELIKNTITPFVPRPIYCMPLDQTWQAQSNVTMLGDAAHVMPPFAGEGVNMAMRDALELCQSLTSGTHDSLHDALSVFEEGMRKRASIMAKESLDNGDLMHSPMALESMLGFFNSHQ